MKCASLGIVTAVHMRCTASFLSALTLLTLSITAIDADDLIFNEYYYCIKCNRTFEADVELPANGLSICFGRWCQYNTPAPFLLVLSQAYINNLANESRPQSPSNSSQQMTS